MHLEPDFWGFAQLKNGNPAALPVRVKAHASECADLPDDATGMGRCLVRLARTLSPKVVVGFHASPWAGSTAATVAYLNAIGANQADVLVIETLDRDAGCFEAAVDPNCQRGGGPWYWDESNATSYRDNRVRYLFAHTGEFVAGAANQTYITTDGGQFRSAVTGYFANRTPLP